MYLKVALYMKLHLSVNSLKYITLWVDGSFGVHWDSKVHNGAIMSMGRGTIVNVAIKHKMNVVSSTELELVSITHVLCMILCCNYFMKAQG